jgi:transcriptional regulator with XRE-family HTH domain
VDFYKNYLALCNRAGKSPSAVALEMGLSKTTVTRWKNGGGVTDATAERIARYFNVRVEDVVGSEDKKTFSENLSYQISLHPFDEVDDIATKIGVTVETFNTWLAGEEYPDASEIEKLANHFGVLKEDLINPRPAEQEEHYYSEWMDTMTFDAMCKFKCLSPMQQRDIIRRMETYIIGKPISFPDMDK